MVERTQTIRPLLPTNCLSVSDHFVGLTLKGSRTLFPLSSHGGSYLFDKAVIEPLLQ